MAMAVAIDPHSHVPQASRREPQCAPYRRRL